MSETEDETPREDQPAPEPPEPPEPPETPVKGMTEQQIRDEGWAIDVPYETGAGGDGPIRYADDAGEAWKPEPGWEDRLVQPVEPEAEAE